MYLFVIFLLNAHFLFAFSRSEFPCKFYGFHCDFVSYDEFLCGNAANVSEKYVQCEIVEEEFFKFISLSYVSFKRPIAPFIDTFHLGKYMTNQSISGLYIDIHARHYPKAWSQYLPSNLNKLDLNINETDCIDSTAFVHTNVSVYINLFLDANDKTQYPTDCIDFRWEMNNSLSEKLQSHQCFLQATYSQKNHHYKFVFSSFSLCTMQCMARSSLRPIVYFQDNQDDCTLHKFGAFHYTVLIITGICVAALVITSIVAKLNVYFRKVGEHGFQEIPTSEKSVQNV